MGYIIIRLFIDPRANVRKDQRSCLRVCGKNDCNFVYTVKCQLEMYYPLRYGFNKVSQTF